jgi:hypothetical protein
MLEYAQVRLGHRPQRKPKVASGFAISVASRLKIKSVRHVQIRFAPEPWLGRSERIRAKSEVPLVFSGESTIDLRYQSCRSHAEICSTWSGPQPEQKEKSIMTIAAEKKVASIFLEFSRASIEPLVRHEGNLAVSLYMPVQFQTKEDARESAVHLKHLVRTAEAQVLACETARE